MQKLGVQQERLSLPAKIKKHKQLIPFVFPAILFALIFCYLPMAGIVIAFKDNPIADHLGLFIWWGFLCVEYAVMAVFLQKPRENAKRYYPGPFFSVGNRDKNKPEI